ncbi:hypothetical protein VPH35_012245 [Triticum aestivum]
MANPCELPEESSDAGEVLGYVKVMTNDQMEALQKQISIYATICEQLVEMHCVFTQHQCRRNLYCGPLMVHGGQKITTRQRWTPTQMQLQILESIFDQGNGRPSKQKIKNITAELSQHGQTSETNVYNWFQNRRTPHNPEEMTCHHLDMEHGQTRDTMYGSNDSNGSRSSGGLGQMTYRENVMSNPRIDQLFQHRFGESFDMSR